MNKPGFVLLKKQNPRFVIDEACAGIGLDARDDSAEKAFVNIHRRWGTGDYTLISFDCSNTRGRFRKYLQKKVSAYASNKSPVFTRNAFTPGQVVERSRKAALFPSFPDALAEHKLPLPRYILSLILNWTIQEGLS